MSSRPDISADDGIRFKCHAGDEQACIPRLDDMSTWARLCGYDSTCIRLCEEWNEHQPEATNEKLSRLGRSLSSVWSNVTAVQPPFLETTPVAGKSYIASVHHPFIAEKAVPFWFLFQPPFSLLNGWEECPEEIYSSHLVHAVLDHVLHREEMSALVVVTVQEMIPLPAIHEHFPETTDAKVFMMFDDDLSRRASWARWLNYVHVSWNFESDLGGWWLFHQDNPLSTEPVTRLVLQGHWGWHDALIWAGNQRLSEAERERLRSFMLR